MVSNVRQIEVSATACTLEMMQISSRDLPWSDDNLRSISAGNMPAEIVAFQRGMDREEWGQKGVKRSNLYIFAQRNTQFHSQALDKPKKIDKKQSKTLSSSVVIILFSGRRELGLQLTTNLSILHFEKSEVRRRKQPGLL